MNLQILYFDGCPSWQNALKNLREALPEPQVELVNVADDDAAVAHQFVGSPTIRFNGDDLFPIDQADYSLGCRVYQTADGLRGWPTVDLIRSALLERGIITS